MLGTNPAVTPNTANSKYGAIKYTYKLTTTLAGRNFNSVTTLLIANAKKSAGTGGSATDSGWDMFMCFKNGEEKIDTTT